MPDSDNEMLARLIRDASRRTSNMAQSSDIITVLGVDPIRVRIEQKLRIKQKTSGTVLVERGWFWRTTSEWNLGVFDEGVTAEGDTLTIVEG